MQGSEAPLSILLEKESSGITSKNRIEKWNVITVIKLKS